MKIAKKVLAVVLAVALVVGSFVIATSAADEGKIYLTLKAQVMDGAADFAGVKETENLNIEFGLPGTIRPTNTRTQQADVATYQSSKASLPYYDSDDVIEVKPGQMIWITTHVRSEGAYYPFSLMGNVFYDTDVFTTVAMTAVQCFQWNANNEIYGYSNTTLSQGNIWGRITTEQLRATYYPTDWTDAQKTEFHYYPWFTSMDITQIDATLGYVPPSNSDLVTVPFYVRSDAPVGATATIFTPDYEGVNGSRYPETEYTEGLGGDIYDTQMINFRNEAVDFSGATLTFKVVGDAPAVDYSALEDAIDAYEALDSNDWTDETWAVAAEAYADAKAALDSDDQAVVTAAAEALDAAIKALEEKVVLSYTRINNALGSVPANLADYTSSTASAVTAAVAAAEAAVATATTQADLDTAAAALEGAVAALELKANFSYLDGALAEVDALDKDAYTADSWAALEAAVAAATFDRDNTGVSQKDAIFDAADAIYDAIDALEEKPVIIELDYTAWNNAAAQVPANTDAYTPNSVAAYAAAKAAAEAAKDAAVAANDQAALDKAAEDLVAAIALLAEKADKAALKAAIADVPAYAEEYYTDATWEAYADALADAEAVDADDNATAQAVADATAALTAAKAALAFAPANYAAVDAAEEAAAELDKADYTADSWAALEAALAAVVDGLDKTAQEDVDAMAADINAAIADLEKLADYSAVEDAIAAVPADTSIYTDETVAAVNDAVAAVVYGLGETQQATVNGFAAAINEAVAKLAEKPADYSVVEAAKAKIPANLDLYTEASVANLNDAVNAVVEGLGISKQADVNAMAAAIEAAVKALELKPTEGRVTNVEYTDVPYATNTFTITVEGRPVKVRFVDVDNEANTYTLTRTLAREKGKIVSYNAAGEVVGDLSRDIAYEVWTVDLSITPDVYKVNVKGNDGWEDLDLSYVVDYKYSADNKAVTSIDIPESAPAAEAFDFTVVVGADVKKVKVLVDGAAYKTFANPVVEDGTATFSAAAKVLKGEHTITLEIKTADGWEALDWSAVVTGLI